jgi:hypothetical protein
VETAPDLRASGLEWISLLQANLAGTIEGVRTVLADLPDQRLRADYPDILGGPRLPTGLFLFHLATHLAHHLGQAGYLRRILTSANKSSGALSMQTLSAALKQVPPAESSGQAPDA